jgi:hypothetical protein
MQAIAGDIGPGHRLPSLHTLFAPVVFSKLRRGRPPCSGNTQRLIVEPVIETAALLLMPRLQFKPSANAARSWPGARRVPDDMCRAITTTGVTPEMAYARWV